MSVSRAFGVGLLLVAMGIAGTAPAAAEEARLKVVDPEPKRASFDWSFDSRTDPAIRFTELWRQKAARQRPKRFRLDVDPIVARVTALGRQMGIPVKEYREDGGQGDAMGITATVRLGEDIPPLNFQIGEREEREIPGAFYTTDSDVSVAIRWKVRALTFLIEGGDESEFGYYGIAGVHWEHPRSRLAAGLGIPVHMRDAEGELGVIGQIRVPLP